MTILARLTLRNMLGKPMRSFAIIAALMASAFAMLFSIGGRDAPAVEMRNMLLRNYGGAELIVFDHKFDLVLGKDDLPEGAGLLMQGSGNGKMITQKGEYSITLRSFDPNEAAAFGLTGSALDFGSGAAVSTALAEKFGVSENDTVTVTCSGQPPCELNISLISDDKFLRGNTSRVIVSHETLKRLTGKEGSAYSMALVDLPNELNTDKQAYELQQKISGKGYNVMPVLTEEMLDEINEQTRVFLMIFAVILLMTVFLTFSMSRHIANERLALVGTLRSLGGSLTQTSRILIIESAVYGLIGGVLGAAGYLFLGDFAIGALFSESTVREYHMPVWSYPLAIAVAVLIQIIAQSGALIKAVKVPVRDIIFSSRDTAYHFSIRKTVIGVVLLGAGSVIGLMADDVMVTIAAITLISVGAVMVLPLILTGISRLLTKLFALLKMPCAKLAAGELCRKKSTVASTQLTFAALAITTAIFIIFQSIMSLYNADIYHFDARIGASDEESKLSFISEMPEVTDIQYLYDTMANASIDGAKKMLVSLSGYDDYRLFSSIKGLGDEPAENEAYISQSISAKYDLKKGDTFDLTDLDSFTYSEDGGREYSTYKLTVKDICDTRSHYNSTIVVSKKFLLDNFVNYPMWVYVNLKSKDDISAVREKLEAVDPDYEIRSVEDIIAEDEESEKGIKTVLYAMTGIGCIIALLGAVSNAVIGFEQSKRKYAVLHSIAASKRKLSKLILLETLISSVTAGAIAVLMGLVLSSMVSTAMTSLGMGVDAVFDLPLILAFVLVMVILLMISAVSPIVKLRKMNTSVELKYE